MHTAHVWMQGIMQTFENMHLVAQIHYIPQRENEDKLFSEIFHIHKLSCMPLEKKKF